MTSQQRLASSDWITAAYRLLTADGPKAIRVDLLCRELGVTKGSFYWHFRDLAALKAAMVDHWQQVATHDLIESLTAAELSPRDLIVRLFTDVLNIPTRDYGGATAETAIRHWASGDTDVQAVVRDADAERLAFLALQLRAVGLPGAEARSRASFLYAALIGLEQLAAEPAMTPSNITGFVDAVLTCADAEATLVPGST